MLDKVRVGNIDDDIAKLLKARFIQESDEIYSKDILQMCTENKPTMKRNCAFLNDLPDELYIIQADSKI